MSGTRKDRNGSDSNAARAAECARRAADTSLHADVRESWAVLAKSYAAVAETEEAPNKQRRPS